MSRPVRIRAVTPREGFKVHLEFTDNTTKEIDLEPYLHGPIFEPIRKDLRLVSCDEVDPVSAQLSGTMGQIWTLMSYTKGWLPLGWNRRSGSGMITGTLKSKIDKL